MLAERASTSNRFVIIIISSYVVQEPHSMMCALICACVSECLFVCVCMCLCLCVRMYFMYAIIIMCYTLCDVGWPDSVHGSNRKLCSGRGCQDWSL